MRKLKTADIFAACRMLKKIGFKEAFREAPDDTVKSREDLVWFFFDVASNSGKEQDVYEFLSGPFEMEPKQIADLDLEELLDKLNELMTVNDMRGFFASAVRSMR